MKNLMERLDLCFLTRQLVRQSFLNKMSESNASNVATEKVVTVVEKVAVAVAVTVAVTEAKKEEKVEVKEEAVEEEDCDCEECQAGMAEYEEEGGWIDELGVDDHDFY
jgi:hypothetical protein